MRQTLVYHVDGPCGTWWRAMAQHRIDNLVPVIVHLRLEE